MHKNLQVRRERCRLKNEFVEERNAPELPAPLDRWWVHICFLQITAPPVKTRNMLCCTLSKCSYLSVPLSYNLSILYASKIIELQVAVRWGFKTLGVHSPEENSSCPVKTYILVTKVVVELSLGPASMISESYQVTGDNDSAWLIG